MQTSNKIESIAKKFRANIEGRKASIPNKSDINEEELINVLPGYNTTEVLSRLKHHDTFMKVATHDELMFILELHLAEAENAKIDPKQYIICAEIYSQLAERQGILKNMLIYMPEEFKELDSKDMNDESLKDAPKFTHLLTL